MEDFGPLKDYILKYYPHKIKDIPVYDTGFGYKSIPKLDMLAIPSGQHKVIDIKKGQYPHSNSLQFPIYDYYINTGGHMVERGMLDGYPVIRGWDIWKFNSEDYMRKWALTKSSNPKMPSWLMKLGTLYVDAAGTPIITKTQWDWLPKHLSDVSPYLTFSKDGFRNIYKSGGTIHIKKKNKGKFTASAKAAGEGVQEHAHKVMNDPNATPLQKKRANFAIQAKKWHSKHQNGGIINYLNYFK